jgi:hypothetical protein
MSQGFVGTNNMPYLEPQSLMGSRYDPRPAEPRYTFVKPAWWLRYVFRKEDDGILPRSMDEGEEVEPVYLAPIIPMQLINGCRGIGTGNSTFVPWYNPLDVLQEMRKNLLPWCRGFKGTIELLVKRGGNGDEEERKRKKKQAAEDKLDLTFRHRKKRVSRDETSIVVEDGEGETEGGEGEEDEAEAEAEISKPPARKRSKKIHPTYETSVYRTSADEKMDIVGFACYGKYKPIKYKNLVVTELPIGTSGKKYKEMLDMWQDEHINISEYRNDCGGRNGEDPNADDDFLCFNVLGIDEPSYELLNLVRRFPLTNMTLLRPVEKGIRGIGDLNVLPYRYTDTNHILDDFIHWRLQVYQVRKDHIIQTKSDELSRLQRKRRFITDVLDGRLQIFRRPEDEVLQDMANLGHESDMINISARAFTREQVHSLDDKIETIEKYLQEYRKKSLEEIFLQELTEFEDAYKKQYRGESNAMRSRKVVLKTDFEAPTADVIDICSRNEASGEFDNEFDDGI